MSIQDLKLIYVLPNTQFSCITIVELSIFSFCVIFALVCPVYGRVHHRPGPKLQEGAGREAGRGVVAFGSLLSEAVAA